MNQRMSQGSCVVSDVLEPCALKGACTVLRGGEGSNALPLPDYCTNPFWAPCAHRMACARCPFYRPKDATLDQLVEGKANLVRMLEYITLTEDECLLVTEGIALHQALIEKLADVPTPAGPTPRELEAERHEEQHILPLRSVQRAKKRGL